MIKKVWHMGRRPCPAIENAPISCYNHLIGKSMKALKKGSCGT
jgi:hypothetical protein